MSNPRDVPHSIASDGDVKYGIMFDLDRTPPSITVENDCGSITVKFHGVTHLNFRFNRFLGFQSWKHSDNDFWIEVALVGGKIKTQYDDREKWITIIAGLDKAVAQ